MQTPDQILDECANTFRERAKVYGKNYLKVGGVLAAMFPDGIALKTPEDFIRFELLLMQVIKLCRYSENWRKGGHRDSAIDNSIYGAMLASVDEEYAALKAKTAVKCEECGEMRTDYCLRKDCGWCPF